MRNTYILGERLSKTIEWIEEMYACIKKKSVTVCLRFVHFIICIYYIKRKYMKEKLFEFILKIVFHISRDKDK